MAEDDEACSVTGSISCDIDDDRSRSERAACSVDWSLILWLGRGICMQVPKQMVNHITFLGFVELAYEGIAPAPTFDEAPVAPAATVAEPATPVSQPAPTDGCRNGRIGDDGSGGGDRDGKLYFGAVSPVFLKARTRQALIYHHQSFAVVSLNDEGC